MKKVRWGLLSTARINRRIIPAIRSSSRGELVAVCSRSSSQATSYAQEWSIPQTFDTYQSMLDSDIIDAVYIALPNHLHAEWAIKAMEAGKHVLLEKPFVVSLAEYREVIATAERTGRCIAEAVMYRHHSQTKILGEKVFSGELGDVHYVSSQFMYTNSSTDPGNFRLSPTSGGGGSLWDVGFYPISLAQFIFGQTPPQSVSASMVLGDTGADVSFCGQLEYQGGRVAHIMSSFRGPFETHASIVGTKGRIEIARPFISLERIPNGMTFNDGGDESTVINVPSDEYLYQGEVEDMHDAILEGKPNFVTLEETRHHLITVLALYKSAREQRRVELCEIG